MTDHEPGFIELSRGKLSINVNVNAGGIGVWLACSAAAVCFVLALCLGGAVAYLGVKVENQAHQLNAIYMMAPHLKPEPGHQPTRKEPL